MSALTFRNLDVSPADPVESWPYEGIVTAIERGSLSDWRRLAVAIRASPWGRAARAVEEYARYGEELDVIALLRRAIDDARADARRSEEQEAARRVRQAVADSGLTASAFARECGTSATRLSTYCSGTVQPSAALLVRFERVAVRCAGRHSGGGDGPRRRGRDLAPYPPSNSGMMGRSARAGDREHTRG